MSDKPHFTLDEMANALREARGLVSRAADKLNCDPQTVYNYLKKYATLRQIVEHYRERRVDNAELKLDEAIINGEPWAIAMTLKTLGKKRGYYEKYEVDIPSVDAAIAAELARLAGRSETENAGAAESNADASATDSGGAAGA